LKFKNNYDTPVYLHSVSTEDKLTITIFGKKKEKNLNIKIQSVVVEKIEPEKEITIDDSLQTGEKIVVQQGRYGYRVKTYKITYKNNVEKKRELISTDFYKPNKSIIRMGPESTNVSDDEVLENMTP